MSWLFNHCTMTELSEDLISQGVSFSCGNSDLDDFFLRDAPLYRKQLLGKTYCFHLDGKPQEIVCAFTLANDSIRVGCI